MSNNRSLGLDAPTNPSILKKPFVGYKRVSSPSGLLTFLISGLKNSNINKYEKKSDHRKWSSILFIIDVDKYLLIVSLFTLRLFSSILRPF